MVWQDIVITLANFIFFYSIANQFYIGYKNKRGYLATVTSGFTSIALYAMALSFFTLSFYFSATMASINATLWLGLFLQGVFYTTAR